MPLQVSSIQAVEPASPPAASKARAVAQPADETRSAPVLPNPQLRLDPSLGLVVLEFRDRGGQPRTIPTERELDAYRQNGSPAVSGEAIAEATTEARAEGGKPKPDPDARAT